MDVYIHQWDHLNAKETREKSSKNYKPMGGVDVRSIPAVLGPFKFMPIVQLDPLNAKRRVF